MMATITSINRITLIQSSNLTVGRLLSSMVCFVAIVIVLRITRSRILKFALKQDTFCLQVETVREITAITASVCQFLKRELIGNAQIEATKEAN